MPVPNGILVRGKSRTIGPLFRSSRYLSGGIDVNDKVGLTYTLVDEKDQWKSALMKWGAAVSLKVANIFAKGTLTPYIKKLVRELLEEGVKNMYESVLSDGDDIIGTVYLEIDRFGEHALTLNGEAMQFARIVRQGRGWVEYRLNDNGGDYTLMLYIKEQKNTKPRPRVPRNPNPPKPPCDNCHTF